MSLISAITVVPQGFAVEFPKKYSLTEEQFERIQGLSALHLSSAKEELAEAEKSQSEKTVDENDELAEYNLDDYDEEKEGDQMGIFNNIKGLAFHDAGEDDPYITLDKVDDVDSEEERDDLQILPTDNIILAAKTEDDVSHLEVYIYEDESSNLYVHHDILIPSFPLCLEWINYSPTSHGTNQVAVGTFEPEIEIWDLDVLDSLYPTTILGPKAGTKRRKKRNDKYHVDAVLSLSANPNAKNLLASASADKSVKLWDLSSGMCAKSYDFHSDKVSAVVWHPKNSTILASGGYDQKTIISDARMPDKALQAFKVSADVESLAWDPFNEQVVYTSTDDGVLFAHDLRATKPLWRIQAHDSTLSAFSVSREVPGLIATGGQDKQLKLWSTIAEKPTMLTSRDFDIGKVFSLSFLPDKGAGMNLAAGGSNGLVRVWDTMTNPAVRKAFQHNTALANRAAKAEKENEDKVTAVLDPEDNEESDDEGEEMSVDSGEDNADIQGDENWKDTD